MNGILAIIAIMLFVVIEPISFVYVVFWKKKFSFSRINGYLRSFAIDVDRFGNHHFRSLFNATLITADGYKFGDFRETISSVLGKNQRDKTLTRTGEVLVFILDKIDKNHCEKSITELCVNTY